MLRSKGTAKLLPSNTRSNNSKGVMQDVSTRRSLSTAEYKVYRVCCSGAILQLQKCCEFWLLKCGVKIRSSKDFSLSSWRRSLWPKCPVLVPASFSATSLAPQFHCLPLTLGNNEPLRYYSIMEKHLSTWSASHIYHCMIQSRCHDNERWLIVCKSCLC